VRSAFGHDFDIPLGYLNTASVGIPSDAVAHAVAAAVQDWRTGAARPADYDASVATARAAFGRLVGVPADRVAIGATGSGLVGLVAASLPDGARVLVARGEFTSVSFPFAAQRDRGVQVVESELDELPARAAEFDLVAVSVVQSADGRIVDLGPLRASREHGTRVLLDATQALGWWNGDVSWADAVVGSGYKWLLSPRGAAWMALGPQLAPVPHGAGWFAGQDPWTSIYGLPLRLAAGARALDTSPAWFSHVGAAVALPYLAGLDRAAVQAHCVGLADRFRAGVGMPPGGSAIVAVRQPDALARLQAAGVVAAGRAGAARLAFHLYNTDDDVDLALGALARSRAG
jgi:selenocysteine lyase/cysteine desulfurase